MMKDTRFGENNNIERLQLLFSRLVMGMPGDTQTIETFGRFVEEKGEKWAWAILSVIRDGYPTVVDDGEGKEYTITFHIQLEGDLRSMRQPARGDGPVSQGRPPAIAHRVRIRRLRDGGRSC